MRERLWLPRRTFWMGALASPLLAAGCTPGANLPVLDDHQAEAYLLDRGDAVRIITFGEDQLTGDFTVNDQGNIALPLVGVIKASGLSSEQLSAKIEDQLKRKGLISSPSVSVEVRTYRPVFLLGEVARPGQYPYQPGMTMLTAVAVAGGFTYRAVTGYASAIRITGDKPQSGRVLPQSLLAPGDVVNVLERYF